MEQPDTEIFKVLSVEARVQIIRLLNQNGPMCVSDLATALDMSPSAVSQHLKIMRLAGLVRNERQGLWIAYNVDPEALDKCCRKVIKICIVRKDDGETTVTEFTNETESVDDLRARAELLRAELEDVEKRISESEEKHN